MAKILSAPLTKKTVSIKLPKNMLLDIDKVISSDNKKTPRNIWVSDAITKLEANDLHKELIGEAWFEAGDNTQTKLMLTKEATKSLDTMIKENEKKISISAIIRTAIIQKLILLDFNYNDNYR